MIKNQINYVLVVCDKCNFVSSQIAVVDEVGEDCNLFEKLADVRRGLIQDQSKCDCGGRHYAATNSIGLGLNS